ncbi:hypothetical protein TA3x_000833 [Tundrisphaera sp. TA3]|uniref:hypothetical protein n=1 Tax=Tundrisphaera sp. TA3 TaxID=3435775 RepID=UPI003EBC3043
MAAGSGAEGRSDVFRVMSLLSLIACLAGTPLRQAEAAHDLARSIDELGEGALVEEVDGGVGDDANVALKACISEAPTADLGGPGGWALAIPPDFGVAGTARAGAVEVVPRTPADQGDRLAWSRRFRC